MPSVTLKLLYNTGVCTTVLVIIITQQVILVTTKIQSFVLHNCKGLLVTCHVHALYLTSLSIALLLQWSTYLFVVILVLSSVLSVEVHGAVRPLPNLMTQFGLARRSPIAPHRNKSTCDSHDYRV